MTYPGQRTFPSFPDWPSAWPTWSPLVPGGEPSAPVAVFPQGPRQILVELFIGGSWVDITSYVYSRDSISIRRGTSSEANVADPATCSLTLDNRDGRFSPRNPVGAYYGLIGRNTPIRVKVAGYHAAGWRPRFWGEVSSWPQQWESSGADVWVPLQAAGVLRRLGQGATALRSVLYRTATRTHRAVAAYWPCEDGAGATRIASGLSAGRAMTVLSGAPTFAANATVIGSAPILTLGTAKLTGPVPAHTTTNQVQVRFLLAVPAAGLAGDPVLCQFTTGGTCARWDIKYLSASGFMRIEAYASDGTLIQVTVLNKTINGQTIRVSAEVKQSGANVDYQLKFYFGTGLEVGNFGWGVTNTAPGQTVTRCTGITINPGAADMTDVAVGHIEVQADILSTVLDVVNEQRFLFYEMAAYVGETASDRMVRLGIEEGVSVRVVGNTVATAAMGPQRPDTLLNLLRECATTDGGLFFEPREEAGLAYRTRESLYNRAAGLTLDYAAHQMTGLEPVDDDRFTNNDVTVECAEGSSSRAVLETGALSVQPPPDGVGRYTESVAINPESEDTCDDHASWWLHLGTVDEARYPEVELNLASPAIASNQALSEAVLDLDVGGRVAITGLPAWLPPDDVSSGVQGITETLGTFEHTVTVNCTPESPWRVGVYDNAESRYSPDSMTLDGPLDTVYTFPTVVVASGPLFTTDPAELPFDIMVAGERMTVTAVNTSTSPQSITVTRSVNGIVKSHVAGTAVTLFRPTHYAL